MSTPRILAFAGSLRRDSYNKRLVRIAAQGAAEAGAEVTYVDLKEFPLPLFDEDLEREEGLPQNARLLKDLFIRHDGFLIASPEYNSSITAVLKNTIDWVSRSAPDEPSLAAFNGKAAALMSASPGGLGGLRGLVTVRSILGNLGVLLLPDQVAIPAAYEAFAEDGSLQDPRQQESVVGLGERLTQLVAKLKAE